MNETPPLPPPGPSTDVLVALKKGWREDDSGLGMYHEPGNPIASRTVEEIPPFSTSWEAAMSLYELIASKGCLIWIRNLSSYGFGHECRILPGKNGDKMNELSKTAQTGQMALCLAFLALPDEVLNNVH